MKISVGLGKEDVVERLEKKGVSRRQFLKYCTAAAVSLGMAPSFGAKIAEAVTSKLRPSVVYLHCAECTGCTEALLRAHEPYIQEILFDTISLDYDETIMAAAGDAAEKALEQAVSNPNGFILAVEGGIPTKDGGVYGKVAGHTMLDMVTKIAPKAKALINHGTCACFGGVQAAAPNPTGAKGVNDVLKDKNIVGINVPGCPPNPYNFVHTILFYLTENKTPELDDLQRPVPFFGTTVHDQCPRLPHFEAGEFAPSFNSEEARKGWCLYELGCKGPDTYNNCPTIKFNQVNWPVEAGHPCIGCSEPDFWDEMTPFYEN